MILFALLGLVPAIFFVRVGSRWRPEPDRPERWAGFLAVGLGGSLALTLLIRIAMGETGSLLLMILLPSICALLAEVLLYLPRLISSLSGGQVALYRRWPAGLLLATPILLAAFALLGEAFVLHIILIVGVLLACGQLVWRQAGKGLALSYPLLVLLLLAQVWASDTQSDLSFLPAPLAEVARIVAAVSSGLGIVFSLGLLDWIYSGEKGPAPRKWILAGGLVVPVWLLIFWQASTASAWDVATDGLGGIFLLELAFIIGLAAAIVRSWRSPARSRSILFGSAMLIVGLVLAGNAFGTYGFDGDWGNVPRARTERRAALIDQAIFRYSALHGEYPRTLTDLWPGQLLYIPTPFMIPRQDWCYQAGEDFYRLGYVYRKYFSTPAEVKVFASAGQPDDPAWPCDAEAARYPAPGDFPISQ